MPLADAVTVSPYMGPDTVEPFLAVAESFLAVVQTVLWWIIRLSPIGTLGLIGNAVATYGWDAVSPLAVFAVDVYVGCAIVLLVLYPVLLRAHGLNPVRFFAGAWPALQLAFVSRSSVGTMPVTEYVTTRNLGVPREYASFAVPLGATTKMDGCAAIYPALAAIFVAQASGVHLTLAQELGISGPALVHSSACSSGAKALASAARLIAMGACDAVIAGGVDTLCAFTVAGFSALESVSAVRCNPLSANRNGINIGEGAAIFLMEKRSAPVSLLGVGECCDAHHISAPDPEGAGALLAMRQALDAAALEPRDRDPCAGAAAGRDRQGECQPAGAGRQGRAAPARQRRQLATAYRSQ